VQSVALRIICEREEEIDKFIPVEYWTLSAIFSKEKKEFKAELFKINGKNPELKNKKEVDDLTEGLNKDNFVVTSIKETIKSVNPYPPYITSKLQQAAAHRFGFTSKKTMRIAQQLYEGINLGSERTGLITYMRTDSTRISNQALQEVREFINDNYPDTLPAEARFYSKASGAQDAHEAIRPTSVKRTPEEVKKYLDNDQYKLYSIIWERFVSSQMINAEYSTQTILIDNDNVTFKVSKTKTINPGFNVCLDKLKSTEKEKSIKLPHFAENDKLELKEYLPEQHFTQPPPRYTDASIVKILEEKGIGRPSTYAPTISTLLDRYYVLRKARQLQPTVLGKLVNKIMVNEFSDIVDINFTARMEDNLDKIAGGELDGNDLLKDFYLPFKDKVDNVTKSLADHKKSFDEPTDEVCEKCGKPMVKKLGRYGFFIACSGFPECRNSKPIPLADCPKPGCNGKVIPKKKKGKGREFYGCSNYPQCDFISWDKPTEFKCPKCGKYLVEKNDKIHGTYKICIDPECGYKQIQEN
jgi:DNA topoisomerase-1